MADGFMGEIRIMSFNFAPKGWAMCNGQFLPINQNQALFSLLGTTYGGNGQTTYALPDLRSRTAMHQGGGHTIGERAGSEAVTLSIASMPTHIHTLTGNNAAVSGAAPNTVTATQGSPVGNFWADAGKLMYDTDTPNSAMGPGAVTSVGGSQPHENRSPFLTLNFCILLQGLFPSQN